MREVTAEPANKIRLLYVFQDRNGNSYLRSLFGPVLQELEQQGLEVGLIDFEVGREIDLSSFNETVKGLTLASRVVSVRPSQARQAQAALAAVFHVFSHVWKEEVDVVMARGPLLACAAVLAARMANVALKAKGRSRRVAVVYDADGSPHDERIDFLGDSTLGPRYRIFRAAELVSLAGAASTVVKSVGAIEELSSRTMTRRPGPGRYVVAPNGRSLEEFVPGTMEARAESRMRYDVPPDAPVLGYCGTMGPRRYPPASILGVFRHLSLLRPDAILFLVTHKPEFALSMLRQCALPQEKTRVVSVPADEVPMILPIFDAGLCLIEPVPSARFVSPIKLGEYLLSGVPVARTRSIGDVDDWLADSSLTSMAVESLCDESFEATARWIAQTVLPNREQAREQARRLGEIHFDRRTMVDGYRRGIELAWRSEVSAQTVLGRPGEQT